MSQVKGIDNQLVNTVRMNQSRLTLLCPEYQVLDYQINNIKTLA